MKKSVLLGLVASCTLVLSACGGGGGSTTDSSGGDSSGKPSGEQVLNTVELQEIPTADISLNTDVVGSVAINACYEGLYRMNADQKLEPAGAAEMAEVSDDGLVYTLKLNEDAKWSNGDPVVADDYVFGWQRTIDPKTASEYAYLFECVKNGPAITAEEKPATDLGIKAIDDYTLEITLEQATPYFEYLLAFTNFFPQNQEVFEKYGSDYAMKSENAVYNGPFTLADFDGPGSDTEWAYVKNEEYWDKDTVKLDKVNVNVVKVDSTALNMFQDGQVDDTPLAGEMAQQMSNDPQYVVHELGSTYYLEMNQREEDSPFLNENLRKAFAYSIDRESFVTNILANGSTATDNLIPKKLVYNDDNKDFVEDVSNKVEYSEKKAKEHWEKAKEELGIDSLEIELMSSDDDNNKKTTEFLQGAFQETMDGLTVKVSNVPFAVRLDRSNKGDFDMVLGGWNADYPDASSFLDLFITGNSYNRGRWSNEEYDKLVKSAATTNANDPEKRWDDMVKAADIIMDECGVIPVYQKAEAHMQSSKIKDLVTHGSGVRFDYKWAYMDDGE